MNTADDGEFEPGPVSAEAEALRRIAHELEMLEPRVASYLSGFALILARVANADLDICDEETRRIESIVIECAGLPEAQAVLVVEIATPAASSAASCSSASTRWPAQTGGSPGARRPRSSRSRASWPSVGTSSRPSAPAASSATAMCVR